VVRRRMCSLARGGEVGAALDTTVTLWKRVQHRQLFRLALEALYYWVRLRLTDGPRTMRYLVKEFLEQAGSTPSESTTALWLAGRKTSGGPVALLEAIETSMAAGGLGLEARIVDGILATRLLVGLARVGRRPRRDQIHIAFEDHAGERRLDSGAGRAAETAETRWRQVGDYSKFGNGMWADQASGTTVTCLVGEAATCRDKHTIKHLIGRYNLQVVE
jgi:hypothetical protein